MSPTYIVREKWHLWLKTWGYLGAMVLLMGLLGWSLLGWSGLLWALGLTAALVAIGGRVPVELILRFYRGRKLTYYEAPELFDLVGDLSRRAGLTQTPQVYLLPQDAINAFATGGGSETAIAVTAGLLRSLNQRELAGVLAHEISHIRNKDLRWSRMAMLVSRLTRFFTLFGQFLLFINLPLLLMGETTVPWLFIALLLLAPGLSMLMQLGLSRTRELDADLDAVRLTGDPHGLANALERIEWFNGGWQTLLRPMRRMRLPDWLRTHPSTAERVQRLRQMG
ncbi:MAG: M48 family metalloprotease [Saprospiraceae bacterium]|nr:M48 family metalloprotease [Saprospiraceae bacterium]